MLKNKTTSWEQVSDWYGETVGKKGHFYHQQVVLPRSLKLLGLTRGSSLLDLACGQGVLARQIPKELRYTGVDISPGLIKQAKLLDRNREHTYIIADITADLPVPENSFSHAAIMLSLQNIREPEKVIANARKHLKAKGKFLIVINHPCFRVPRQTRWEVDPQNRTQYRRIDRYMSPLDIPVSIHPGKGDKSETAWSYHLPLSEYSRMLFTNAFVIEVLEEWVSEKQSAGSAAKMENRARSEFPLFMAILARKEV